MLHLMVSVELVKFHFNHSISQCFLICLTRTSLAECCCAHKRARVVRFIAICPPCICPFFVSSDSDTILRLKLNSFCAYFGLCIFSCFSLVFVLGCVHVDSSFFTSHHLHQNCVLPPSIFSIKVVFAHLIRS